jgi:peptidoglycan/xylan/chitin deacetylase (PgdA/CDA1 family)
VPERAVAFSFDDGYADIATAAPLFQERGMRCTVFCVAGYLGGVSDWPTLPARAPRLPLATAAQLAELAAAGFEIGSHGIEHSPLHRASERTVRRELVVSRAMLEQAVGAPVRSFAFPYGAAPPSPARGVLEGAYEAVCVDGLRPVHRDADPLALPRVDAYYLKRQALLGRALKGSLGSYFALRRAGARARRLVVTDYRRPSLPFR